MILLIFVFVCLFQIRELDLDVIGFQEVRSDTDGQRTQLTELQDLLPEYQWSAHKPIHKVTLPKRAPKGWEWEGRHNHNNLPPLSCLESDWALVKLWAYK